MTNGLGNPKTSASDSGLANPGDIEHSWSHAPHDQKAALDRFEAAVAFAIREAARLHHERRSGPLPVSGIVVPGR